MAHVRWTRSEWETRSGAALLDDLHGTTALVLDDVRPADADRLSWWSRAPCVVVATGSERTPIGDIWANPPNRTSGVSDSDTPEVRFEQRSVVEHVVAAVERNPDASRMLVDVLRTVPALGVDRGLAVESTAYSVLLASPEFTTWLGGSPRSEPDETGEPLRVDRDGPSLHITLTRPECRNAFSAELRDALCAALDVAAVDPSIETVVVSGEGPAFSSGGHLGEFGRTDDVVDAHRVRTLRSVGARVARLADRCRFEVHGPCVGAGVELPAFAGHVVARGDTTFRLPEIAMGLIPGAGGTVSLPRRIGVQRTAELALTGQTIDAEHALRIGLIDEITPD